jgi:hypothetical protein
MPGINGKFAFSVEIECLTATPDDPALREAAIPRFLHRIAELAPSVPATSGVFNGYAKIYCDVGHIEIAVVEVDSPYLLTSVVERVQCLAGQTLQSLAEEGTRLLLANNNHSGLLENECPVWGDHENYLVEQHPTTFGEQILPFLVTRIYGGSGGVLHPTGSYLAAVRPICMALPVGGGTTEMRAIHSTSREEHHMGRSPGKFRYHLILGDGHRSQFNLALQFGATALAIKAILSDARLRREVSALRREFGDDWVAALKRLNVLAPPGQPIRIDPLIIKTQRVYLEGARRYAASLEDGPAWIDRLLTDWEDTLAAYERLDHAWLAARLDAFAKYQYLTAALHDAGVSWAELPGRRPMFCELALLDHSYHEFCNPESAFDRLEAAGALRHRVCDRIEPGQEDEPYVPETGTRARARARFIRDNQHREDVALDWSWAQDMSGNQRAYLRDPFAAEFGPWESTPTPEPRGSRRHLVQSYMEHVLHAYDAGRFEEAATLVDEIQTFCRRLGIRTQQRVARYNAWLRARTGQTDGAACLDQLYRGQAVTWSTVLDYCNVYRYGEGLRPSLQKMDVWLQRGKQLLESTAVGQTTPDDAAVFREHAAATLIRNSRVEEAFEMLESCRQDGFFDTCSVRLKARLLAVLGEAHRVLGNTQDAMPLLVEAHQLQSEHGFHGQMAFFTLPALAKCETARTRAKRRIAEAIQIQKRHRDRLGLTTTQLLQARLIGDVARTAGNKRQVTGFRDQLPALRACPLLAKILEKWDGWVAGEPLEGEDDPFWGV